MNVTIENSNDMTIAHLEGRLDASVTAEVTPYFEQLQNVADGTVLLDCKDLTYISSPGLRLFLTLRKASIAKGGTVIVKSLNNDVRQVFMITGFLNMFKIQ